MIEGWDTKAKALLRDATDEKLAEISAKQGRRICLLGLALLWCVAGGIWFDVRWLATILVVVPVLVLTSMVAQLTDEEIERRG